MTKKKRLLSVLTIAAASIMLAASLSACGGASGSSGTSSSASGEAAKGSYSSLDDGKTAAKKCLSEYDSGKNAAVFAFANGAYSKANDAAGKVNADTSAEDVEKAASELGLERLDITDENGTVTSCYPEGDKDKSIKEIKDIAIFNKVVKGISDKYMKDPEYNADKKSYYILAGVKKEDGGVSVIGYYDESYAAVCGGDLAEKCGDNTVIVSKDKVISSSLDGVEAGASLEDIGVKSGDLKKDSFELTVKDKKYNAAAVTKGDITAIVAIPA